MEKSRKALIKAFDPNGLGNTENIFGLPFGYEEAQLVLLPVPWEVTVSYDAGTAEGPAHIKEASLQVDLYQKDIQNAWQLGIYQEEVSEELKVKSDSFRIRAEKYIALLEQNDTQNEEAQTVLKEINAACKEMVGWVEQASLKILDDHKILGLVGGDHSTPLGALRALSKKHQQFGVLQIDAHMDLRNAYEDFQFSHASISRNFLELPNIEKLVQVGIRDFCEEELEFVESQKDRIAIFYDDDIKSAMFEGESWSLICDRIIKSLPEKVYISFDIDGLEPSLCPDTGTPVPGGLSFQQVNYLIVRLVKSGKTIIGFDLNEVAPGENTDWNGNVGARVLYRLCNLTAVSQGLLEWNEQY